MLEKSILSNQDIIEQIKKNYRINVIKIEAEKRGSANIYYIYDELQNKYVLKEFESACNEENVLKEINITNHLNNHMNGIKVPEYIKTKENQYYFKYKSRTIILMKYIQGYTKDCNTGNLQQTLESAEILGKTVKALESYSIMEQENIEQWYNKTKIIQGKQSIIELKQQTAENKNINTEIKEKIVKDLEDRIKIIEELEKIDFEGMQYITSKNSHGDFSIMQFIYQNEKVYAILDFAKAKSFPIVWEIIRSYSYIDQSCKNGTINTKNLVEYVKIVMKYINLNEYDLKFMPYVYLIQLVTSTFGYKQYLNNTRSKDLLEFGIWRTKISKYIFNNLIAISEELAKQK